MKYLIILDNGGSYSDFRAWNIAAASDSATAETAAQKVREYIAALPREQGDENSADMESLNWNPANLPVPPYSTIDRECFEYADLSKFSVTVTEVPEV